jgi:hypothetical protein
MLRPSSIRTSSLLRAGAPLLCVTAACLSGETVDLGTEFDASAPPLDSPSVVAPESSVDAGESADEAGDAVADAPSETASESSAPGSPFCIPNPSFEMGLGGDAAVSSPEVAVPAGWLSCPGSSASAAPTSCLLPPTDGSSYLALSIGFFGIPASVDVMLCEPPIVAGITYTLSADIALDAPLDDSGSIGEPPVLQIRASNTACDAQGALLLRFAGTAGTCSWRTLCGSFTAADSYSHLMLIPETGSAGLVFDQTHLLVDHLVTGGSCADVQ